MRIPNSFKTKISETFYDKNIKKLSKEVVTDDEGWTGDVSSTEISSFYGNVKFDNLAEIQEDYGIKENIDIVITTNEAVDLGDILEYEGIEYRVVNSIPYDSHNLIFGKKWLSRQSGLTSV